MSAGIPSNTPSQPGWWHIPIAELFGRVADWFHLAFRSDNKKIEWIMAQFTASQSFPSRRNRDWAVHHLTLIQHRISEKSQFLTPDQEETLLKIQKLIRETFRPNSSEGVPVAQTPPLLEEAPGGVRTSRLRDEGPVADLLQSRVSDFVTAMVRESLSTQGGELALRFREGLKRLPKVEGVSPDRVRQQIVERLLVTEGVQQRLREGMEGSIRPLVIRMFDDYTAIKDSKSRYDEMLAALQDLSPELAGDFRQQLEMIVKEFIGLSRHSKDEWQTPKEFKERYVPLMVLGELWKNWDSFREAINEKGKNWLSANQVSIGTMVAKIKSSGPVAQDEYVEFLNKFPPVISEVLLGKIFT